MSKKKPSKQQPSEAPKENPAAPYVDRETREIRSVPLSLLETKEQALAFLNAVEQAVGKKNMFGETNCLATHLLRFSLHWGCMTLSDIQTILQQPIQYLQICDITLRPTLNPDVGYEADYSNHAQYIDLLLFLAELHDPSLNRLRKARPRYEMVCLSDCTDYKETPEPTVATVAWEKRLRESPAFAAACSNVLHFADTWNFPYWTISMGSRCTDARCRLLAFDADLQLNVQASKNHTDLINDPSRIEQPDGETIRPTFIDFCMENNLEFAGTPFYPIEGGQQPSERPIHFLAQQVSVSFRNNAYQVFIPSFYRSSHIEGLLDKDFYDLEFALTRKLAFKSRVAVSTASREDCPLSASEMDRAAKCIHHVLSKCFMLKPEQVYQYTSDAMSPWWRHKPDEYHTSLLRILRQPKRGGLCVKSLPAKEVVRMVADNLEDIGLDPALRYAFDRYRSELRQSKYA